MRGLSKPSNSIPTKNLKIDDEISSSPEIQPSSQPIVEESGMRFLVEYLKLLTNEGSNLMFGNDVYIQSSI